MQQNNVLLHDSYQQWNQYLQAVACAEIGSPSVNRVKLRTSGVNIPIICSLGLKQGRVRKLLIKMV